jgi:molybdenum cofactor synthesis domain-containing protein
VDVAIVTVGDELLSGDITNTNASWLASALTDRGVRVTEIVTIPDDRERIITHVRRHADARDAVIVTGGLGGTPDDITITAVAEAFDRGLAVNDRARAGVVERVEWMQEHRPDLNLEVDIDTKATLPAESEALVNEEGLSPGCRIENVFVFPGIPSEMKAMFATVADRFAGDRRSITLRTDITESRLSDVLADVRSEFEVEVGSYPSVGEEQKRLKIISEDPARAEAARDALAERLEAMTKED